MNLTYVVKLGWREEFKFDSMLDAGAFATAAATHRTEDSDNDQISIKIVTIDKDDEDAIENAEEVKND